MLSCNVLCTLLAIEIESKSVQLYFGLANKTKKNQRVYFVFDNVLVLSSALVDQRKKNETEKKEQFYDNIFHILAWFTIYL